MSTSSKTQLQQPLLAGFGNPLLDISIRLDDISFYKKYGLQTDGQKEVTASELRTLYNYLKASFNLEYHVGGCAQNTLRIFQRLIKESNKSVIFGGIGKDEHSEIIKREVESCGVITRYAEKPDFATGTCIALRNGIHRSLVAHLGAAEIYSQEDFMIPSNKELFSTIQIVYIEGFFVTHSFEAALEVVKLCKSNGIVIAFNINGAYLFENNFYKEILYMIQVTDIVFGNASEYNEFWKYYSGMCEEMCDLKKILHTMQQDVVLPKEENLPPPRLPIFFEGKSKKILICTQGSEAVLCVHGNMELFVECPEKIEEKLIIDTTGAGDSFVGGFLAGILRHKSLRDCIKQGCWVAGQVIQRIGCNVS